MLPLSVATPCWTTAAATPPLAPEPERRQAPGEPSPGPRRAVQLARLEAQQAKVLAELEREVDEGLTARGAGAAVRFREPVRAASTPREVPETHGAGD